MPDHVHLLIDCNPSFGILDCVKRLKSVSANTLKKEFPEINKTIPCLWTRSAFISSVGTVSLDSVRAYIEEQRGQ